MASKMIRVVGVVLLLICLALQIVDAGLSRQRSRTRFEVGMPTTLVSRDASLSTGMRMRTKSTDKTAKPFAALAWFRNCQYLSTLNCRVGKECNAYNNPVIPRKDCDSKQLSNKIPPCSDISSHENAQSQYRKWMHESREDSVVTFGEMERS